MYSVKDQTARVYMHSCGRCDFLIGCDGSVNISPILMYFPPRNTTVCSGQQPFGDTTFLPDALCDEKTVTEIGADFFLS